MPPTLGGIPGRRVSTALLSAVIAIPLALSAPAATSTSAVAPASAPAMAAPTKVVTSTQSAATSAWTYTDRLWYRTGNLGASSTKASRVRYASYLHFSPIRLTSTQTLSSVKLSLKVTKAAHSGKGLLRVRLVTGKWTGSSLTYRSRPKLGATLASFKPRAGKTVSLNLSRSKVSKYLKNGLTVQVLRTKAGGVTKLSAKSAKLSAKVRTMSVDSGLLGAKRPVFALYFTPYPISLDNVDPTRDYYARNYLKASGENGKWASVGGLLRDRPVPRDPLPGDWEQTDMQTEVRQAMNAGINGFYLCSFGSDDSNMYFRLSRKLMQAASAVSSDFKVMLMPDMSVDDYANPADLAKAMATLASYDSAYRLTNGKVVISPFYAERYPASYYSKVMSLMKSTYGVDAALMPMFLEARHMSEYASISFGFANWGVRDSRLADNDAYDPDYAAQAHAMGKLWMEPIAVQDERPNTQKYAEASNTETLQSMWNRASRIGADATVMLTWNDYSEGTSFAPSVGHGWSFLDLNSYFLTRYRTGSFPAITDDKVIITHRVQWADDLPTSYSAVMKLWGYNAETKARDKIEVATLLTAPGTVSVTIAGSTTSYDAPAGFSRRDFDLATGLFTATVSRDGNQVATVTTKDAVSTTVVQQDLAYHAVESD